MSQMQTPASDAAAVETLTRHRHCRSCRYDLYSLPVKGACPECGTAYVSRGKQKPRKNPRRQHAQLSRMLRQLEIQHDRLPWMWIVPGGAIAACILLHAGRGWWFATVVATLFATVRHLIVTFGISDVKEKLQKIDWTPYEAKD